MTFNKQDLEDAFDDLGFYDLLSNSLFKEDFLVDAIECQIQNAEKLPEIPEENIKKMILATAVSHVVSQEIDRLQNSSLVWRTDFIGPERGSFLMKMIKFIDLIYQGKVASDEVFLCDWDLFEALRLHPKASAGVENTFHLNGNRVVRKPRTSTKGSGILVPKNFIYIQTIDLPKIEYAVLHLKDSQSFYTKVSS